MAPSPRSIFDPPEQPEPIEPEPESFAPELDAEHGQAMRKLATVAGALAVLIGLVGLLAWALPGNPLVALLLGDGMLVPNAAACLLLAGLSLLLLPRGGHLAARALAALVVLVMVLTLAEHLLAEDFGIDHLLLMGPLEVGRNVFVRPSANTALALLLIGAALLLLDPARRRPAVDLCAFVAAAISMLALLGYAFGLSPLYRLSSHSSIPLPGAVALLLLSLGVWCVFPEQTMARTLMTRSLGGDALRRLWPAAVLLPPVAAWLASLGLQQELYGPKGDLVLLSVALMAVLSIVAVRGALWLDRMAAERQAAASALPIDEHVTPEAAPQPSPAPGQAQPASADLVLASLGEGICRIDRQGSIDYLNPAAEALLGHRLAEVRGQNLHELAHSLRPDGTFLARKDCALCAPLDSAEQRAGRDQFRNAGGKFIEVEYTLAPLRLNDEVIGTVLCFRDISERLRAERRDQEARGEIEAKSAEAARLNAELGQRMRQRTRELEVANRELDALSNSLTQDLRAPLRSIDGFSHILLDEYADKLDADGRGFLERVRNAGLHMGQMIDALLQLARITRTEMHFDEIDLSQLASEIAANLQPAADDRRAMVYVVDGLTARGDRRLLSVALQNLLGNAFKFTSRAPSPEIEFGSWLQDGNTIFFVRDNGAGFAPEDAPKLFNAFQRLHAAAEFEGSGIGLAIVQRIVQRHGGRIWAEGAPGKGATFYFTLNESLAPHA